jgi:hypothetical protein
MYTSEKWPAKSPKKEIDIYPNLHAVQPSLHLPSYYNKKTLGRVGTNPKLPPLIGKGIYK